MVSGDFEHCAPTAATSTQSPPLRKRMERTVPWTVNGQRRLRELRSLRRNFKINSNFKKKNGENCYANSENVSEDFENCAPSAATSTQTPSLRRRRMERTVSWTVKGQRWLRALRSLRRNFNTNAIFKKKKGEDSLVYSKWSAETLGHRERDYMHHNKAFFQLVSRNEGQSCGMRPQ